MRIGIIAVIMVMIFPTAAMAKIEYANRNMPREMSGAKIISASYRYYDSSYFNHAKKETTEIRVRVQKNKLSYLFIFSGEHLHIGDALFSKIGQKVNIIIGTGRDRGLFIIGK